MLAATERSLEIERQQRRQLLQMNRCGDVATSGSSTDAVGSFRSPRRSAKACDSRMTSRVASKPGQLASTRSTGDVRLAMSHKSTNGVSGRDQSNDNRQQSNAKEVGVRRGDSLINGVTTTLNSRFVTESSVSAADSRFRRETVTSSGADEWPKSGGTQTVLTRHCSSLLHPSTRNRSRTASPRCRSIDERQDVGGRRRSSRLDRHVYQCYFAGILHSSRCSERFTRLQQLYSALGDIVQIESELPSLHQRMTSSTHRRGFLSRNAELFDGHSTSSSQKYWRQKLLELRKLYAKLDAAQEDREFFYDNGHMDAFQWKPWKDNGLNKKCTTLAKVRSSFEAPIDNSLSESTKKSQVVGVEHSHSYEKLLGMFQRLEKRMRKDEEACLRWQSSSQQFVGSERKLDGTYIKMMESAARNANTMALHGYHMNEHQNRYDTYVQSRRIYRPKSVPNFFEQESCDEEQSETSHKLESDTLSTSTTNSATNMCDKDSECCRRRLPEIPASVVMDSSASFTSTTTCDSTQKSLAAKQIQVYSSIDQQSPQTEAFSALASNTSESLSDIASYNETMIKHRTRADEDSNIVVNERGAAVVKVDAKSHPKSKKREKHRPVCRNGKGASSQRTDSVSCVPDSTSARRHIDAWRRSSCLPPGTRNTALEYFNSLCLDDSNDSAQHVCGSSVTSLSDSRETCEEINSGERRERLTSEFTNSAEKQGLQVGNPEKKFSTELKLIVNEQANQDRRKIALPQVYSGYDVTCGASLSMSCVPRCSRAANIDKHRQQYVAAAADATSQRRRYTDAGTKKSPTEADDVRSLSSTAAAEVSPHYVTSAPVVRMLSESEPIQTSVTVSSPVTVDCRQAVVRKLPTLADLQRPAGCLSTSDCVTTSLSHSNPCSDTVLSATFTEYDCPGKNLINLCHRSNPSKIDVAGSEISTQPNNSSEYQPSGSTKISYATASNFICGRCCQSLGLCNCQSVANNEKGARIGVEHTRNGMHCDDRLQFNYTEQSVVPKSANNSLSTVRRTDQETQLNIAPCCQSVKITVNQQRRGLLPDIIGRSGFHDPETQRMMASLETINSEWTSHRPTRSTQRLDLADNTEHWNECGDERPLTCGRLHQHANKPSSSGVSNGIGSDLVLKSSGRMANGDSERGNNHDVDAFGSNMSSSVNDVTDSSTNMSNPVNSASRQNDQIQRLCALYNYRPRHADELELNKGDTIHLTDVCDDGWCWGISERTNQFGSFPGNYVRPVT